MIRAAKLLDYNLFQPTGELEIHKIYNGSYRNNKKNLSSVFLTKKDIFFRLNDVNQSIIDKITFKMVLAAMYECGDHLREVRHCLHSIREKTTSHDRLVRSIQNVK